MSKEPLVLLHGFSGVPTVWEPVAEPLAEHHELHVLSLAGHAAGRPLPAGTEYSIATLADELEGQMDAAGLGTAHVCGNSLGGWLAIELGVRGRARSVVAIAPAGGWTVGSAEERRLQRFFRMQYRLVRLGGGRPGRVARHPALRRFAFRDACVHGDRWTPAQAAAIMRGAYACAWKDVMAGLERHGPPVEFARIDVPVRLVWGTRDRILPHGRYSRHLRDLLPDAEYVQLEGVGHVPMIDDPQAVSRAILEVTARVASPG